MWLFWNDTVLQAEAQVQPTTRIPLQPKHIETPTHIETRTHNQCGDTIEILQVPEVGCINYGNMLSNRRSEIKLNKL